MSNNTASLIRAPSTVPTLQRTMSISSEAEPDAFAALTRDPFAALTRDPFAALTRAPSTMPTLQRSATLMPLQEKVVAPATLPPLIRTTSYRPVDGLTRSATISQELPVLGAETYAPVLLNEIATARDLIGRIRNIPCALPRSSLRRTDYGGSAYEGGDRTYRGGPEEELSQK